MENLSDNVSPLISIITVSFNAVAEIENTILSVLSQSYHNIEYIVVDGGSTDGTVDIIEKYADKISYWLSEPDKGIYDAMNKGIDIATGKWINFMNSGDVFFDNQVLEQFVQSLPHTQYDICYGDTALRYKAGLIRSDASSIEMINKRLPFCHQSSFVLTDLLKKRKYNLDYRICADYDFFYNEYISGKRFCHINLLVTIYEAESGLSVKQALKSLKEMAIINGRIIKFQWKLEYLLYFLRLRFYPLVKSIIPNKLLAIRRNSKYKFIK